MKTTFKNKKITGIIGVLPEDETMFEDEVGNYSFPKSKLYVCKKLWGTKSTEL